MRVNTRPYIVVFDSGSGFGVRGPDDFEEFGHRKFDHAEARAVQLRRQRLWLAADGIAGNEDVIERKTGEWDDDVNSPANAGNQTIPETESGEIVDKEHEDDEDPLMHGGGTGAARKGSESLGRHEYGESPDGKNRVPGGKGPDDANFGEVQPDKSKAISVPSSEKESNATHVKNPNEGSDPFKELPTRGAATDGEVHQAFRQANQHSRVSEPHHTQPVPYMAAGNPNHAMNTVSANNMAARAQSGVATDPPVSQAQRAAMHAAAEGHSTLGIPKSVGQEFSSADPGGHLPAHAKDFVSFLRSRGMSADVIADACHRAGIDCHY
jgi:hypothetical protein